MLSMWMVQEMRFWKQLLLTNMNKNVSEAKLKMRRPQNR